MTIGAYRRAGVVTLATLLTCSAARAVQAQQTPSPDREVAVVAQELDAAWNTRDAARFSALFTEDASFAFPVAGIVLRGREEIRQFYAKEFPTYPPDLRHVTKTGATDVIGPDLQAVDAEVDLVGTDPKTGKTDTVLARYRAVSVSVRTTAGWRIRVARVYSVVQ